MPLLRIVAVGWVVAMLLAPTGAAATEASTDAQLATELGLSATTGYDGQRSNGLWQPVLVALDPVRPVAGELEVAVAGNYGTSVEALPVEVAAGSRKEYRFFVPRGEVGVLFREAQRQPIAVRPAQAGGRSDYLVGVLDGAAEDLPPLRSEVTGSSGTAVGIDAIWLEESPFALEPLSAIVAEADVLAALGPEARANLLAGVTAGTDLVVTGVQDAGLRDLGLPWSVPDNAWDLDPSSGVESAAGAAAVAVPAGRGRVSITPSSLNGAQGDTAAFWSLLAQPGETQIGEASEFHVSQTPYQFSRMLATAGSSAPALPWLGAFVAIYVLVVGPVNAVVLNRMGRRELAWATIPLVTLIFTSGAFFGATTGRPPTGGAMRLTYWNDGAATEYIAAGVRAATPGSRSLQLPGDGWSVRPLVEGGPQSTVARGTDTTITMELTALQLGGVAAWRSSDAPAPLEVEATATPESVDVTVRNASDRTLRDVVVRAATATRSIPELAPGEEHTATLGGRRLPQGAAYRDPFEGLPLDSNGVVGPPLSLRAVVNAEVAVGDPGLVWVSAVDVDAPPTGVTTMGEPTLEHGAMVAVGTRIEAGGGLSPFTVAREAMVDANGGYRPGPEAIEGAGEVFLRFRLPGGATPSQLRNELDRSNQSGGRPDITVWDRVAEQWIPAARAFAGPRERMIGPLGDVWTRASGELFPFEYSARTIAGGGGA